MMPSGIEPESPDLGSGVSATTLWGPVACLWLASGHSLLGWSVYQLSFIRVGSLFSLYMVGFFFVVISRLVLSRCFR